MEAAVRLERKITAALRWPPVEGGLPVVTVRELLETQRDLLILYQQGYQQLETCPWCKQRLADQG